jgi:hypothetical protein
MRAKDWSATPLGPPETWSPALKMMVGLLLANRFPQLLWWGPDYISIYNDAYRPVLGTKHPTALGRPFHDVWPEVQHVLGPLIDTPFRGGPANWTDDIQLEVQRYGFAEGRTSPLPIARGRTTPRRAASAGSSRLSAKSRRRLSASAGWLRFATWRAHRGSALSRNCLRQHGRSAGSAPVGCAVCPDLPHGRRSSARAAGGSRWRCCV